MAEFPQSREEAILQATINGEEYTGYPESRIEELLIELKEVIEEGGGGGGAVDSVNGQKGVVVLDAEDVGALPDNTTIPSKTSDLTNDSGFITKAVNDLINYYLKSETYTKTEVNALIGAISTIHFEAVLTLPTEDIQTNVIYLVPKSISQSENVKDEYINLDGTTAGWEKIGETEIDLSNYVTTTALNTALANYVTSASLATTLASYAQTSQLPGVATASTAGLVKPDGVTTSVNAQGALSVIEQLPTPPVINLESIASENDVNSKSATFTASSTSKYMLIMAIANSEYFPIITSSSVTVNDTAVTLLNYYASSGYGVNSKYAILDLTSGDTVAASFVSSVESYGTSVSIMLIKLSEAIGELTLEDSQFSNVANIASEINADTDGFYLLFFFKRANGVGRFNAITRNGKTISNNIVICSQGSTWQVSHGICIVSAKTLDTLRVAMNSDEFVACGIMSLATSGESYSDLIDKPQINGVELSGNKTASQLSLVAAEQGKGLSTNDYTNVEKSKLATVQNGANRKHKKLYTLDKNNWREITQGSGHYVYDLLITSPMLSIQDAITMYYGEYHNSYEDPYFDDSKWNVYKNIYMGEYGSSVDDPPASAHLYFCDPMTMHAPAVSINVYIEGIVYEG